MKNIFVIGLDPFNLALLRTLSDPGGYAFHDLLSYHEAVRPVPGEFDLADLLAKAEARLAAFEGSVDAIIGYWDFPSTVLVPILCHRRGMTGPTLRSVAACEHKFWCRLEQRRAVPELVPRFQAVDPFASNPLAGIDLAFPFWIKPVKAHSSYLGFRIRNAADLDTALPRIRAGIGVFGKPLNTFLAMTEVPPDVDGIDGHHCIAEEIISAGRQCTLEGYVWRGSVTVYGVVDSIRGGVHRSCFERYQYPSRLPRRIQERMVEAAIRFVHHVGYDDAPFNMEFYWDSASDRIRLLEVNTRISKSHSPLFLMVDGVSNQAVPIELGLGQRPGMPHREGRYRVAAKFMVRAYRDGVLTRVPTAQEISELGRRFPDLRVRSMAREGTRLAHLSFQDSYSYEFAEIFLGANTERELRSKYRECLASLPFRVEPVHPEAA